MPINVRMKPGFMFWGLSESSLNLQVPFPTSGTFETSRKAQTQNSADGSVVAQMIGRSRDKQTMVWDVMDCETWWTINNWLETNGMVFFCRYFNFNLGVWCLRRFYVENPSCEPYRPTGNSGRTDYGMPRFLQNCQLTVMDLGGVT